MSLILEALKKLDREKQTPGKGVVVLGATAWAARSEGRSRLWLFLLADLLLVALGGALVFFWLRPSAAPPAPSAAPSAAAPEPAMAPAQASTPAAPPSTAPLRDARVSRPPVVARPSQAPAPTAEPARPAFVLQAVTEQDGQPVALISDRLLHVGEGFDGMRVVSITPTEAEIEIEATGERRTLTF